MAYSSLADVRAFGVSEAEASDSRITAALDRATGVINRYCGLDEGESFGVTAERTVVVDGVYNGVIPLPTFDPDSITAVEVGGYELAGTDWEPRSYGVYLVRLHARDADGFPLEWNQYRLYPRVALTAKVTATFGAADLDPTIADACTILAAQFSRLRADDAMAAHLTSMKSKEIAVTQARPIGPTTGNLEVDAMLDDFVRVSKWVD